MAIPTIRDINTAVATGTNVITLSEALNYSGDLLIIMVGCDASADGEGFGAITSESGWTQAYNIGDSTSDTYSAMYWKMADGTENTTIDIPLLSTDDSHGWYISISDSSGVDIIGSPTIQTSTPVTASGFTTALKDDLIISHLSFDGGDLGTVTIDTGTVQSTLSNGTGTGTGGAFATVDITTTTVPDTTFTTDVSDGSTAIQFSVKWEGVPITIIDWGSIISIEALSPFDVGQPNIVTPSPIELSMYIDSPDINRGLNIKPDQYLINEQFLTADLVDPELAYDGESFESETYGYIATLNREYDSQLYVYYSKLESVIVDADTYPCYVIVDFSFSTGFGDDYGKLTISGHGSNDVTYSLSPPLGQARTKITVPMVGSALDLSDVSVSVGILVYDSETDSSLIGKFNIYDISYEIDRGALSGQPVTVTPTAIDLGIYPHYPILDVLLQPNIIGLTISQMDVVVPNQIFHADVISLAIIPISSALVVKIDEVTLIQMIVSDPKVHEMKLVLMLNDPMVIADSPSPPTPNPNVTITPSQLLVSLQTLFVKTPLNSVTYPAPVSININSDYINLWSKTYPAPIVVTISTNNAVAQPDEGRRVSQIGSIVLNRPLHWGGIDFVDTFIASKQTMIDGSTTQGILPRGKYSKAVEISSKGNIYVETNEINDIISVINDEEIFIYFTDGKIEVVKFNLLNNPLSISPTHEGSNFHYVAIRVLV